MNKTYPKKEKQLYAILTKWRANEISDTDFTDLLEDFCKGQGSKSYWWRNFKGDTLVSDWQSVMSSMRTKDNYKHLVECTDIALENKSLTVFYS